MHAPNLVSGGLDRINSRRASNLSTKWVVRSSEHSEQGAVVVNPEAITITDAFPSKPLNFVMIFGPARSGKSFFMNALARRDGIFRVSPAAVPCTNGVDLSTTVVSLHEFMGTTSGGESEDLPCIGFIDVEGLGDRNPHHHVKLAIPPMLVSKVLRDSQGVDFCTIFSLTSTDDVTFFRPDRGSHCCTARVHLQHQLLLY